MWGRGKHLSWLTLLRRVFKTSLSYPFYIHAGGSVYLFFVPLTSSTFQRLFQTIRLAGSWCGPISTFNTPRCLRSASTFPGTKDGWNILGVQGFSLRALLPSGLRQRFYWRGPAHHRSANYRGPTLRALQTAPLQALHHPQQRQGPQQSLLPRESIS
jgi:hypothetical protein